MWRDVSFPFFPARKSWCSCRLLSVASSTGKEKISCNIWLFWANSFVVIENLKSPLFQSFWEWSQHCYSTPPVLLERKKGQIGDWGGESDITVVSLDWDFLHLTGVLQAQCETLREGASGNPTGVAEKELVVSVFYAICLFFLLFEDVWGREGCVLARHMGDGRPRVGWTEILHPESLSATGGTRRTPAVSDVDKESKRTTDVNLFRIDVL